VKTTAIDEVAIVPAELGTWAGAIGAAVHGAEEAVGRDGRSVDVRGVAAAGPP